MAIASIFTLLGSEETDSFTWVDCGPIQPLGRLSMLFSHSLSGDDDDGVDLVDDYRLLSGLDEADEEYDEQPLNVGSPELEGDLAALESGQLSHTQVLKRFVSYRKRMFRTYIHLLDRPEYAGTGPVESVEAFQTALETYHAAIMNHDPSAARQQLAAIARLSNDIDRFTRS